MTDSEANIHSARVYLAEARRRRRQSFWFVLIEWAGNARRRAGLPSPAGAESAATAPSDSGTAPTG